MLSGGSAVMTVRLRRCLVTTSREAGLEVAAPRRYSRGLRLLQRKLRSSSGELASLHRVRVKVHTFTSLHLFTHFLNKSSED